MDYNKTIIQGMENQTLEIGKIYDVFSSRKEKFRMLSYVQICGVQFLLVFGVNFKL
jgi:hypothetical protein